ncbi:MAG: PLP-dependent aminotransferase family protein [Thermoanaerobaculia bacterium]
MIDAVQDTSASRTSPAPAELEELLALPGVLSLAADLPAAELFPMSAVAQASARLLGAPEYGAPFQPLKTHIVELMAMRGVRCRPEQIVLTTGVEGALDLLGRLLLAPGSPVLLEETLSDKIRAAIPPEAEILTVSTDPGTGIDVDQVEALLAGGARPAFLYVMPEGHNPLGVSLSLEKRLRLLELARAYEVPILEDDTFGFLSYDGHPEPPLRALDASWVVYLGSFSMLLAPALRAGWIVLPDAPPARLALLADAAELDVPSFSHRTISAFLEAGYLPEHLENIRAAYRRRRDTLLRNLQEHFPRGARWSHPSSGLYVWVELPGKITSTELLRDAVTLENVAFAPGPVFAARGGGHADQSLRLSFGSNPPHRIEEGVLRLARVLQTKLG